MIFTCNDFQGHWPVGAAAVVEAPDPEAAATRLSIALKDIGLEQEINPADMVVFGREGEVSILCDDNY